MNERLIVLFRRIVILVAALFAAGCAGHRAPEQVVRCMPPPFEGKRAMITSQLSELGPVLTVLEKDLRDRYGVIPVVAPRGGWGWSAAAEPPHDVKIEILLHGEHRPRYHSGVEVTVEARAVLSRTSELGQVGDVVANGHGEGRYHADGYALWSDGKMYRGTRPEALRSAAHEAVQRLMCSRRFSGGEPAVATASGGEDPAVPRSNAFLEYLRGSWEAAVDQYERRRQEDPVSSRTIEVGAGVSHRARRR